MELISSMFCWFSCFLIMFLFISFIKPFKSERKALPLPPGTMGSPYIGETFQLYSQHPIVFFANKIKSYFQIPFFSIMTFLSPFKKGLSQNFIFLKCVCSIFKSRILQMKKVRIRNRAKQSRILCFASPVRCFSFPFTPPHTLSSLFSFFHFQPLKGVRITVFSDITTATATFIQTSTALGAEVRCCSFSTQNRAAAIPHDTEPALQWGPGGGQVPDPFSTDNSELQIVGLTAASVETTEKETKGQADGANGEEGNVFTTSDEENKGEADNVFVPKDSDEKGILEMLLQACCFLSKVALRVIKSSKVSINLIGPKVSIDFPVSALWND